MEIKDIDAAGLNIPALEEAGRSGNVRIDLAQTKAARERQGAATVKNVDSEMASRIAETMNDIVGTLDIRITFSVDQGSGRRVIKVIDNETKELIRQIPPDEMLKLVGQMHRIMGMLLNKIA